MKKQNVTAKKTTEALETVFIPKKDKHDDSLFVAVNGRRILVKKGETVSLPAPFAEVIRNSFIAEQQAEKFISSVSDN
ncbi:MAG: hypothetical protein IKJ88_09005 [Clostridia bacterium]|nr:hypothetical protein [Clostridia bacterium]